MKARTQGRPRGTSHSPARPSRTAMMPKSVSFVGGASFASCRAPFSPMSNGGGVGNLMGKADGLEEATERVP